MSGLDFADIQGMTRRERLHQTNSVNVHSTHDGDVEDLMRAAPHVEFTWSKAFGDPQLYED